MAATEPLLALSLSIDGEENLLDGPRREELRQRCPPSATTPRARLLDRDAPFGQSRGRWNIRHESRNTLRCRTSQRNAVARNAKYAWDHWFYSLAYKRTSVVIGLLFLAYASIIVVYAYIYLVLSKFGQSRMDSSGVEADDGGSPNMRPFCGMHIDNFSESLYFSLSTMTSIGYGISDYFFGHCWTPFLVVLLQVFTALCFDAIAVGLVFHRFSRGHKRGKTVVFSSQAVVVADCLAFRVAELRTHTLLSATIRCYCIAQETTDSCFAASIVQSDDYFVTRPMETMGGEHILMRLPQVVCHKLDSTSPLTTTTMIQNAENSPRRLAREWQERQVEIVVMVEGMDELTGTCIQARHSYTSADILWGHRFVPCVDATTATVDFLRFHATEPVVCDGEEEEAKQEMDAV